VELAALADLVQWVDTGVAPAGGDATVAGSAPAPVLPFGGGAPPPASARRPMRCAASNDR
jgi:hypothetical protein